MTPPRTPRRFHPYGSVANHLALRSAARIARRAFQTWRTRTAENQIARQYDQAQSETTTAGRLSELMSTSSSSGRRLTGGVPIHHSTSGGRFAKGRGVPKTLSAEYCLQGFAYDSTTGGRVQDGDCVYIGHTSWPADRVLYTVCLAFVRAMLRHCDVDIETIDSVLPFVTGVDTITIEWLDSSNTVVTEDHPYSPGASDTVGTLAITLFTLFRGAIFANAKRYYQRLVLKTGDTVRVMLNLATAKVDICNTSYLKVQNSTQSAESGGGGNDSEDIAAVPLQGFSYFGRGNFTGLKPYSLTTKNTATGSFIAPELNSDATRGLITLRAPNGTGRTDSGFYYSNPPPAAEMKNCSSSAFVALEPGVMKTDKLEDCHKMTLNQFLYKNYIAGYVTANDSGSNGQWSRSMLGHFKVFALEKKLYSNNQDQVQIRYEVNHFVRARVMLRKQSHSLQQNLGKELIDFVPP